MALTDRPVAAGPHPGGGPPPLDRSVLPRPASRLWGRVCAGGALVAAGATSVFLFAVNPNSPTSPYPQCLTKALTGVDCPGCGGLRATHALLHGDIAAAVDHNALVLLIVPAVLFVLLRWALGQFGVRLPTVPLRPWMAWSLIALLAVFSVVRNIVDSPFFFLNSIPA
jgi:hypothetical protein